MDYYIGFRSGERLAISVKNGEQLVKDIIAGMSKMPTASVQWFVEPGFMLNVSEITYVVSRAVTVTDE